MFTLMIVEDEDIMIRGLVNTIDWNRLGFKVVAEARNGRDAFEIFKKDLPDVVLTDIKMTYMDGLELLEAIKNIDRNTEVILISGYDDFEFARSGLELGAFSYILKVNFVDEIEKVFKRLYTVMLMKLTRQNELNGLIDFKLKEQLLNLVKKDDEGDASFISGNCFCIAVIGSGDKSLSSNAVICEVQKLNIFWAIDKNVMILFFKSDETHKFNDFVKLNVIKVENILKSAEIKNYNIGLGGIVNKKNEIRNSYNEAIKMYDYGQIKEGKNVRYFEEEKGNLSEFKSKLELHMVREMIISKKIQSLLNIISRDIMNFIISGNTFIASTRSYCIKAAAEAAELLKELDVEEYGKVERAIEKLKDFDSSLDMEYILKSIISGIYEKINIITKSMERDKSIMTAVDLVNQIYNTDLCMKETADYVHVSPSYFSRKFKEEMGVNFKDYLIRKRLEEACRLLEDTDIKISDIAGKVGYDDDKYFTRIFREKMNISPGAYRENIKKVHHHS